MVDKNYIPKNLNDCVKTLDEILSEEVKKNILKNYKNGEDFASAQFFDLGLNIRNAWLYRSEKLLNTFPTDSYLLPDPDTISSLILKNFYDFLKNKYK